MAKHEPSSLALARSGVPAERARDALELLAHPCRVCPRECTVDRLADERGLCRIGRRAVVASAGSGGGPSSPPTPRTSARRTA
jgi:putative pyruvate formate lyase activating enzyme